MVPPRGLLRGARASRALPWVLLASFCALPADGATANLPRGIDQYSIITKGDAYLTASSAYRGLAIGGRLCDGTIPNRPVKIAYPCYRTYNRWRSGSLSCRSTVSSFAYKTCMCSPEEWGSTLTYFSTNSQCQRGIPRRQQRLTSQSTLSFERRHGVSRGNLVSEAHE